MSIESRSRQYGKVFDHWKIRDFLGSGSGGKSAVFRLVHSSSSSVQSALKVISLIEKRGNFKSLSESRKAEYEHVKQKCKDCAEQEVLLMNGLQGRTNVVDYLDHTFIDWADENGFGCDMLIRMELLKDLRSEIEDDRVFSQNDILKIGRDICTALVLCHSKNILHRDIKPENIFFNDDGNYKLGDFGVSRILSATPMSKASTGVCTPEYAAPEQISGKYDTRVDIYSLGLVLYELSNGNLLPFATSSYITETEVQERMLGTPLSPPRNASKSFAAVILKACSFNPEDRYQTAEDFLAELNYLAGVGPRPMKKVSSVGKGTQKSVPAVNRNATQDAAPSDLRKATGRETVFAGSPTYSSDRTARKDKPKYPKAAVIGIVLVIILAIGTVAISGISAAADRDAIAEIINEANTLANAENYSDAIAKLQEGLDQYPDSDELTDKFNEINGLQTDSEIAAIISAAESLANNEDFEGALAKVNAGITNHPNSIDLQTKADEYANALNAQIKESALTEAAAFADSSDYISAITVIKNAQKSLKDDEELAVKATEYEDAYALDISTQVDALLASNDIVAAKDLLQQVKKDFPGNEIIQSRIKELDDYKTVSLSSMSPTNGSFTWNDGDPKDPFGNSYSSLRNYVILHSEYSSWDGHGGNTATHSVEYQVSKKYDTLAFTLVPYSEFGENGWSYLRIYVDGVLRYTSSKITQKTQPEKITVDISDAEYIKIIVYTDEFSCTMMTDVLLSKLPNYVSSQVSGYTSLSSVDTFNGSLPWENDYPCDTLKSEYNHVTNYAVLHADYSSWDGHGGNSKSYSVEYYVNKRYSDLSFDIAPAGEFGSSGYASIKVYADDVLVYTAPALSQKTARFNTGKIDISQANYIKIVAEIDEHSCTIISNALLKNAA